MAHLAEPYQVPVAFGSHFKLTFRNADIEVSCVPTFSFDAPSLLNFFLFPLIDAIAREVIKGFKTSKSVISGAIPGCAGTTVPWIKRVFELYLWQQLFHLTASKLLLCLTCQLSLYFHPCCLIVNIQGEWEVSRHWEMVITSIFPKQRWRK